MDSIKAHIDGSYFSVETLRIILAIGPYVSGFIKVFLKRETRRDLLHLLPRFGLERQAAANFNNTLRFQVRFRLRNGLQIPIVLLIYRSPQEPQKISFIR